MERKAHRSTVREEKNIYQRPQHNLSTEMSQNIADHLKEFKAASSVDNNSAFEDKSGSFNSTSFPHRARERDSQQSYGANNSANPHPASEHFVANTQPMHHLSPAPSPWNNASPSPQFKAQQPLPMTRPPNTSFSIPQGAPPPPSFFHPSAPPPNLPPFPGPPGQMYGPRPGQGGQGFPVNALPPPPPFPPPNYGPGQPQNTFAAGPMMPQNSQSAGFSQNSAVPPFPPRNRWPPPQPQQFGNAPPRNILPPNVFTPARSSFPPFPPPNHNFTGLQGFPHQTDNYAENDALGKTDDTLDEKGVQQDVNQWLRNRNLLERNDAKSTDQKSIEKVADAKEDEEGKQQHVSIVEAGNKLRKVLHALAAVQGELQQLEEQQTKADLESWQAAVRRITELKNTYLAVKHKVDLGQLKSISGKLQQRRSKRERQKRRKQEKKEEEQQILFERTQKHAVIDRWRDEIRQEYLNQQQVKRMKETADKTLSKVRREIRDARKMLDTVTRLHKLRAVRNDTAEKRGQTFPPSVGEHFKEKTEDLSRLLTQQIESCEKEEAALKLILETEKEEAKEKEREEKQQKDKEEEQQEKQEEIRSLFDLPGQTQQMIGLESFTAYYQQAQYNLHSLRNIRQEWDLYLVPEETPMASRVPDGWVRPEPPSSTVWASALTSQPSQHTS